MIPRRFTPGAVGDPLPPSNAANIQGQAEAAKMQPAVGLQPGDPAAAGIPQNGQLLEERQTHLVAQEPAAMAPAGGPAAILQQLSELRVATPDAKVRNPGIRDNLVSKGLAVRASGYTIVTGKGIGYLVDLGML
jgi:hypothetical protein